MGTVESIWTAPEGSAPMERTEHVEVVSGGLAGDRYSSDWKSMHTRSHDSGALGV